MGLETRDRLRLSERGKRGVLLEMFGNGMGAFSGLFRRRLVFGGGMVELGFVFVFFVGCR